MTAKDAINAPGLFEAAAATTTSPPCVPPAELHLTEIEHIMNLRRGLKLQYEAGIIKDNGDEWLAWTYMAYWVYLLLEDARNVKAPSEPEWHKGCSGCWRTSWH